MAVNLSLERYLGSRPLGSKLLALVCATGVIGFFGALASAAEPLPEPQIVSVYPLGGQPGTSFTATIRGQSIDGAYALWFESSGIEAAVEGLDVEQPPPDAAKSEKKKKETQLLRVRFQIGTEAEPGEHSFRVVTSHGLSNALKLHLHAEPSVAEQREPHELPTEAQPVQSRPAAVHGRIAEVGEVDYYSIDVRQGEELRFEALSSDPLDPAIAIYELTGSWFSPDRATRLAFHDDPVAYPGLTTETALNYRFEKTGNFLVRVNGFWGYGGADHSYVLRILPAAKDAAAQPGEPQPQAPEWRERTWTRHLDSDRMKVLWSRSVPELAPEPPSPEPQSEAAKSETEDGASKGSGLAMQEIPVVDADAEPTKVPVEPPVIPLPALVVGTVERPGDIDRVRFSVEEGDKLVLEVETPDKTIPLMNPYLRVVDAEGVEAFTNVYSRVNANGNISKLNQPKTAFSFPREGDFTLEIRDVTASYGDSKMRYRVLVRPQVPHMGEVHVTQDRLNLVAGQAKKLSVITDQEEGFDGFVVLSIEGLPEGVRAVMATEVEPDSPPPFNEGKKERFTTKSKKATFLFLSERDTPVTRMPVTVTVYAQPVVEGQQGRRIPVKELLVMVVQEQEVLSENLPAKPAGVR